MVNLKILSKIKDFIFSSTMLKISSFICFTVVMTAIVASQNFFF